MSSGYRQKERKPLWLAILLGLAILTLWMALSPYGLWQHSRISRQLEELKAENARLEQENQQLLREITLLRNDPQYIEEMARREYGLLKKNELIFDFSR